jgi:hypothetical protein
MPRLTTRGACGYGQQGVQHASDLTLNTLVASSRVLGIIDERLMQYGIAVLLIQFCSSLIIAAKFGL